MTLSEVQAAKCKQRAGKLGGKAKAAAAQLAELEAEGRAIAQGKGEVRSSWP
jgi:hypothetical protein